MVFYKLHVGHGGVGEILLLTRLDVFRCSRSPANGYRGRCLVLGIGEEEQLVLDDGTADGGTVCGASVAVASTGNNLSVNCIATHVLVVMVHIGCTLEFVRTGLGYGIDTATDEIGLANIKGRDDNLQFLDCIDGNRAAATRETVAQAEVVVEVGTVHGKVGSTSVHTGKVHAVATIGRKACDVGD